MLKNIRKLLMGLVLSILLLPMTVFASTTVHKGKETVNINRANAAALAAHLPGIGANKAEIIVKFRKANGQFKNVKDIMNVPGVGEKTYNGIRRYISTSRGVTSAPKGYSIGKTSGNSPTLRKKSNSSNSSNKKTIRRTSNNTNSISNSSNNSTNKKTRLKKIKKKKTVRCKKGQKKVKGKCVAA